MGLNLNGHLGSASPYINSRDVIKDSLHREFWSNVGGLRWCLLLLSTFILPVSS